MQVLDGRNLYENGTSLGLLQLEEGQRSNKMIIIERFSGEWCDLKQVELTEMDRTNASQLFEAGGNKAPRILMAMEGRFQASDMKNANGRIYPGTIWEKIIPNAGTSPVLGRIARGEMLGEVDHPGDGQTLLKRVGCMTTNILREGSDVRGRMIVFDTAVGRDVKAIVEGGGRVGVSSRGQGSVVRLEGTDVVQDDYQLETWDVVHNPSTPGAYPDITIQESAAPSQPQQEERMGMLADLRERFERLKKHIEGPDADLTESVFTILNDEAKGMATELTEGKFGGSPAEVAAIAADVQYFLNRIGQLRANPIKGIPLGEEDDPLPTAAATGGTVQLAERDYKGDPKAYAKAMGKAQKRAGIKTLSTDVSTGPFSDARSNAIWDARMELEDVLGLWHPITKKLRVIYDALKMQGGSSSKKEKALKDLARLRDSAQRADGDEGKVYSALRDAYRRARASMYNEARMGAHAGQNEPGRDWDDAGDVEDVRARFKGKPKRTPGRHKADKALVKGAAKQLARYNENDDDDDDTEEECNETFQRATTAGETVEVLENVAGLREKALTVPMTRFVHEARKAYRDAAQVDGMIHRHELDGISSFVRDTYEAVEKDEITETMETPAGRRRLEIIVPNAGKLDENTKQLVAPIGGLTQTAPGRYHTSVPIDKVSDVLESLARGGMSLVYTESTEAFDDAAERFQPLLDRQMSLTQAALTEAATGKAWVTEMSAIIANVKQAMQMLTEKARERGAALQETEKKVSAATALIEAFAREFGVERVRGAVQAVAQLHPSANALPEKLSEARSVEDCVRLTRGEVYLENLPIVERNETRITEAVQTSQRARQKRIEESAKKPGAGSFKRSIVETTEQVVGAMDKKYGRKDR